MFHLCNEKKNIVKYWFNLLKTNMNILKSFYDELFEFLHRKPNYKENWLYHIEDNLCKLGFNYFSENQGAINDKCLQDNYVQALRSSLVTQIKMYCIQTYDEIHFNITCPVLLASRRRSVKHYYVRICF